MIKRVYIDTSVFGGYFDSEFAEPTKKFFKVLNTKNITILVSERQKKYLRMKDSK